MPCIFSNFETSHHSGEERSEGKLDKTSAAFFRARALKNAFFPDSISI